MTGPAAIEPNVLDAAREAVRLASVVTRYVAADLARHAAITKSDKSPVTIADLAAQAVVARHLHDRLGPIKLLGEESASTLADPAHRAELLAATNAARSVWPDATPESLLHAIDLGAMHHPSQSFWTLDPIDGTRGFLRAQHYCTALAYIEQGVVTLGVLACPSILPAAGGQFQDALIPEGAGSLLWAVLGGGAFVAPLGPMSREHPGHTATRIPPPTLSPHAPIRLASSLVSNDAVEAATARVLSSLPPGSRELCLDSQSKYAITALGQADAFLRLPLARRTPEAIWDHAAGVIVCTQSGRIVTDARGLPLDFSRGGTLSANRGVVAAAPAAHTHVLHSLRALGLDGP